MRRAAIGLVLLAVTACGGGSGDGANTLRGTFTLVSGDSIFYGSGDMCTGDGGYDDIGAGLQVVVRDGDGSTLATGRLKEGEESGEVMCVFEFTVVDVPDSDFYTIEVGSRGELTYTAKELEKRGWRVEFTIGP